MEYNLESNRESNFKIGRAEARGRFEIVRHEVQLLINRIDNKFWKFFCAKKFVVLFQNLISLPVSEMTHSWSFFAIFKETFGSILMAQYDFKLLSLSLSHKS